MQDNNIICSEYLLKKNIINKNYILVNDNIGFEIDTSFLSNEKSYNQYFTKFILDNISINKDLLFKYKTAKTKKLNWVEYFYSMDIDFVFTPLVFENSYFIFIEKKHRTDQFNYSQMFMVKLEKKDNSFNLIKVSGYYE